jgi:WD40 repeat protein
LHLFAGSVPRFRGGSPRRLRWTPDGRRAVPGSTDRTLRLWDLATGCELAVFTGDSQFSCCAVTPDGRFVVAGDRAGQVHVLEILL